MKLTLLKIETYGVKNLKNKITLDFTASTISNKMPTYKIKAIYGLNGAGKTAIINSVKLYKNLTLQKNFLVRDVEGNIVSCINKRLNEFYFKIYFKVNNDNESKILTHEILLKNNKGNLYIAKEILNEIKGISVNGTQTVEIYKVLDGVLYCDLNKKMNKWIYDKTINNLYQSTLTSNVGSQALLELMSKTFDSKIVLEDEICDSAAYVLNLVSDFIIYSDFEDKFYDESLALLSTGHFFEPIKIKAGDYKLNISNDDDLIYKVNYDDYVKEIKKLENFIRIFKPDLKSINITKKVDGKFYRCQKNFDYGDYQINSSYESTGIKKLMRIHTYINDAINGKYVFIDEFDNSLNGIYLDKLLEFFIDYGKGILCFTAHNLEPITVLKKETKSLLFLGETGKLVTWAKNGNYNPINYYRDGMIEDSPFNILKFDFYDCFDVEE